MRQSISSNPRRLFPIARAFEWSGLLLLAATVLLAACSGGGGDESSGGGSAPALPRFVNAHPASVVIGQVDLSTTGVNQGGIGVATLAGPFGGTLTDKKLIINDTSNSRVLIFDGQ